VLSFLRLVFTPLSSLDHDIAAEIEHLTTSMDGSDETVVAGLAPPPFLSH